MNEPRSRPVINITRAPHTAAHLASNPQLAAPPAPPASQHRHQPGCIMMQAMHQQHQLHRHAPLRPTTVQHRWLHTTNGGRQQHLHHRPRTSCRSQAGPGAASPASTRLQLVLDGIDALNSQDPRTTEWQGQQVPYELAYSRWLTGWVERLQPQPGEELRIVARGQHVERWKSPRTSYPEGRAGYLKWREQLKRSHAATVTGLMQAAGYEAAAVDKVERCILKKGTDPENQVVEDALCLVFLQHQFTDLLAKKGPDTMVDVVRKSLRKMSEQGQAAAVALTASLPPDQQAVVTRALAAAD